MSCERCPSLGWCPDARLIDEDPLPEGWWVEGPLPCNGNVIAYGHGYEHWAKGKSLKAAVCLAWALEQGLEVSDE